MCNFFNVIAHIKRLDELKSRFIQCRQFVDNKCLRFFILNARKAFIVTSIYIIFTIFGNLVNMYKKR